MKKRGKYTAEVELKDPDLISELQDRLELTDEESSRLFRWGDYLRVEVKFTSNGNDVTFTGRLVPIGDD